MQDSTKIEEFSLEDIKEKYHLTEEDYTNGVAYGNNMVVSHNVCPSEITYRDNFSSPIRPLFSIIFLCTKGNTLIRCNSIECRIQVNTLFACKPGSVIQFIDGNLEQISVICLPEKPDGVMSLSLQKLLPHYTELEALTVLKLSAHETKQLNTMIGFLSDAIKADHNLLFYHESVKAQASALIFNILNLFCSVLDLNKSIQHTAHYRQQDYVRQFMSLLSLHFRQQRRVTFYSDQMHITPKYLGTIVTQQTGRTVSDWIDHFVVSEAKVLLRSSSLTIQEITYKLNFPNQSFFCKYFKAHTGLTPSGFRSQNK